MRDFTEIEQRMRSLVASLKGILSGKEMDEILHFIEHGEYGVALESLKYVYDKNANPPASGILSEMDDLSRMMKMQRK